MATPLFNPVLPDDLPSWVTGDPDKKETPAKEDALPDWVLNDPKPSKEDDISDIINDPIDERHVMLSTGLFRAVDKEGNDKEPTGEFFVVPTPEAAKSGVYRNNKLFKEYNPEFEWSGALPAVGDLIGSTAKGIVKMSGPNQVYKLAAEGPSGAFKQGITNIMSAAEGAAQGGEFAKDVIGNIASYGAKKFQPDDQEDAYQYEKDVQDIIKKKSTEGQTTIGKAVRALSGDENAAGAQLADQLIDKDIATAAGIFADPVFAVTGPGKYLKGLVMAKDATKLARIAELTSENAAKMSLKEARDLAIKQVQSETPLMVKNISDIQGISPVVKGISELIPEGARRFGSIAKTAIENPSATVMQGAGKALRGASNAVIKAADWALGPGTVPALARGAAGLYTSGPLGAIAAMALGDSPKLRGIVHGGKVFATLGDLLDTAGSAIKGGGDAKALRTAGMNASEAGTREAAARAAGLNPEITDTSKLRVLKSPLLRVANFVGGDVVDPALRGAALGAAFNAAAGEDPSSGVLPGAFYGLAGHGFGSFGKLLSGGQRDPVTSAKFATKFLNSLDPETRKIWRRQDPRAIDFFGDVDFMVRAANDRMAKINGKPAIQIKYAGTPQEVREAYLAGRDGQADQAELKDAHAKAQDTNLSPAQRLQSMQQIQALNDRINKSSRASGWVAPTPEGGMQMVINASTDLNPGQISHEALGHVLDQIDFATDREGKNNPLRDAREEMISALFGTEPSGVPGEPEPVKGQYSEQDLQNMAERYFSKLGRSPRLETDAQGNAILSAEDRQTMLKELVAEHSNLFTQNARALGKDAVQHALDVVNGTDEDVAAMLQESGSQSNLFAADGAGRVITNDVPTERAAAERILSLVEASAAPDATLRITKDGVEIPQSAPITRSQLSTEAKKAHENYDLAQTYDEAVKARQAKDAIADSIIYQTAAKPPKVAQAEAAKEFELKTGRKPSKPELQAAAAEIMAESPRVVVNNRKEVYSPGDTPILLTKKEQEDAAKDLGKTVKVALAGIPAEEGAMVLKVGPDGKEYMDGTHFSDAQIKALRAVPNAVLPKSIKDTVVDFNRTMRKGGGTLKDFIYHQAMKRQGNIPRSFRSVSPFSFGITKADNILVRSWDVTNIYRKLEKEGAKRQSNTLEPFREPDETDYGQAVERFAGSLRQFGQNHSEGKLGSVGLHPDEKKAYDRADAIAKFLGFGKDRNVDLDSMDSEKANSFTRSFRVDRMFNVKDSLADPLKLDYRKTRDNLYMPEVTENPNFQKWFGDSKVVDSEGNPKVVYHGSSKNLTYYDPIQGSPTAFDPKLSGKASRTGAPEGTFFFSDSPEVASSYTVEWQGDFSKKYKDAASVTPAFLSFKKPFKVNARGDNWRNIPYKGEFLDINELAGIIKNTGKYDGLIVTNVFDRGIGGLEKNPATTYVAFHPEQIKSATGNSGAFDPKNPDIRFMPEVVEETKDYSGLHYNGSQETPSGPLHYFTDLNEDSPAHGGTFTVLGQVTPEAVESARQKQVERFTNYMPETNPLTDGLPEGQRRDYSWLDPRGRFIPVKYSHGSDAFEILGKPPGKHDAVKELWDKGYVRVTFTGNDLYAHREGGTLADTQKKNLERLAESSGKSRVILDLGDDYKTMWVNPDPEFQSYMPAMDESGNPNPGFYSSLEDSIEKKMPARAKPEQIMGIIKGSQLKPEEIKWSNIEGFLSGKDNVSKQEVMDYLKNEGALKFEEVTLDNGEQERIKAQAEKKMNDLSQRLKAIDNKIMLADYNVPPEVNAERKALFDDFNKASLEFGRVSAHPPSGSPKYGQYQLPGGENYREVVLAMPDPAKKIGFDQARYKELANKNNLSPSEKEELGRLDGLAEKAGELRQSESYFSSHFNEIPNYIAHMRLNDRQDSEGRPGLFMEEAQSDRGQSIRKEKGTPDEGKTPSMTFEKDWPIQLFKRALRDAVASDKEWIGWTPGKVQADRYDLSKQVGSILYKKNKDGTFDIDVKDNDVGSFTDQSGITEGKLADFVGKDVTQRIADGVGTPAYNGYTSLTGLDLKVGGEGMVGFYDQILPKEVGKYVKKWGGKVEEGNLPVAKNKIDVEKMVVMDTSITDPLSTIDHNLPIKGDPVEYWIKLGVDPKVAKAAVEAATKGVTPIWKVSITPQMRESVSKGQPLFMPESDALPDWVLNDQPESIGIAKAQEDDDKLPAWVLQD